jgi:BirA family transcriptional regulator, biotin operon repressor / biotin---[acetyl-CoA-carboxylase] ligase
MIIGNNMIFYETLPSTNSHAAQLLRTGNLHEGTIIYTDFQSVGKGQMGNRWESETGNNLLISVILYPTTINPSDQFLISMAMSLGICDFLKRYITGISIKWPNDIYVNNDKIAGILIENSIMRDKLESTIAGIGLNINQEKFISDAPNPVSLKLKTGENYDLKICLNQLAYDLDQKYNNLLSGNYKLLKDEYVSQLYRLNQMFEYKDKDGIYSGRIRSVTDYGRLKIERQDSKFTEYSFKEVEFIL